MTWSNNALAALILQEVDRGGGPGLYPPPRDQEAQQERTFITATVPSMGTVL